MVQGMPWGLYQLALAKHSFTLEVDSFPLKNDNHPGILSYKILYKMIPICLVFNLECEPCKLGKHIRSSSPACVHKCASAPFPLVHFKTGDLNQICLILKSLLPPTTTILEWHLF